MSDEFELEHWRSRALKAEAQVEAARPVLAGLRIYFMREERPDLPTIPSATLPCIRENLRSHDREHWTEHDVMDAVAEGIAGVMLENDDD